MSSASSSSTPKGALPHRALGDIWATLMAVAAASSFWIHTICQLGGFSALHLLSIFRFIPGRIMLDVVVGTSLAHSMCW